MIFLASIAHCLNFAVPHCPSTATPNDEDLQSPVSIGTACEGCRRGQDGAGRNTEETCTTYNMMKIARYLFRWSGDPRYADYYERAVSNGMLGSQRMPANYTSKNHATAATSTSNATGGRCS